MAPREHRKSDLLFAESELDFSTRELTRVLGRENLAAVIEDHQNMLIGRAREIGELSEKMCLFYRLQLPTGVEDDQPLLPHLRLENHFHVGEAVISLPTMEPEEEKGVLAGVIDSRGKGLKSHIYYFTIDGTDRESPGLGNDPLFLKKTELDYLLEHRAYARIWGRVVNRHYRHYSVERFLNTLTEIKSRNRKRKNK